MKNKSLSETHPEIAIQWHPTKNASLTPFDVTPGSNKRIWWICDKGHEYYTKICHRTGSGSRCPHCYGKKLSNDRSLLHKRPDLAVEWHPTKNEGLKSDQIHASSRRMVWWLCSKDDQHEWESTVDNRNKGNGCPYCKNRGGKINQGKSLGHLYKFLLDEWDHEKNIKSPHDYAPHSNEKVSWICKKNKTHKWDATIAHRVRGTKCPFCSGNKMSAERSLTSNYPDIAAELHPSKNGTLTAADISIGSSKKIYWQCSKDSTHFWKTSCCERVGGSGCPHCINGWSIERIRLFVISLLPYINTFDHAELFNLCSSQSGALNSQGKGRHFIKEFVDGKFPQEELQPIVDNPLKFAALVESQSPLPKEDYNVLRMIPESDLVTQEKDLPVIETRDVLAALDSKLIPSSDAEIVDFFIKSGIAKIWRHAFFDEKTAFEQLEFYNGDGEYAKEVKKNFLEGYKGAKQLEVPEGYNPNPPSYLPKKDELGLMQRFVAHQIRTKKRLGNWSGTGAGKTLSAVLASRIIDAKLTIVCCPNNVIDTWIRQIKGSYPDSEIWTKASLDTLSESSANKYLILNYEFFQQPASAGKLQRLVENCKIDFMVIDEIHYSKQRKPNRASKRKTLIMSFLSEASKKYKNLCVLGMSATPVINELFEGKTLIELITGAPHDELDTKPTPANCMALYKQFISNGIRYIPNFSIQFKQRIENIDCSDFIPEIRLHVSRSQASNVELEAILTKAKLPCILENLRPKTIVYTHYRDGIELILRDAIELKGWKVALFNGDTKEGLAEFVVGDVDILIASSCVGTGIDGLQKICNRLIINCLPWTHAEYKQLIGRIYRQGQNREQVDVIIPLTFANINGGYWSWCESRWKRIQFKKSIADAAVDGVMPEGHLRSAAQAHKDIMDWFKRLDQKNED